ncbi:hypothetical protein BA065_00915 [Nanoarchaeota archaeon NZ13-N]|uniref:Replication protein A C-terminal domain-containing protein n=1 Tax=Candidatus Nanoclepta minutus TaxID=1940235 RepID=A0A397WNP9_9ARCH|nr:MAG: hypothetical protein BA065_00915 [Nanoarchaeota archaeon NZ13-N]RIB35542.1 MAG: hypothetical protein BXU00_00325 [Candidatus Nanoclepta minutus]
MHYKPILSSEIGEYTNKNVALIGKVVEILNERKYIKIKCLDSKGYFESILYEPINVDKFSSVIILGKIKEFQGNNYVYINKLIKIEDIKDEILWKKLFLMELKKRTKKKTKIEEKKEVQEEKIEFDIRDIRKDILKFIKESDKGEGVSFDEIKEYFDLDEDSLRKYIEDLLSVGEIYEVSSNKYKVI